MKLKAGGESLKQHYAGSDNLGVTPRSIIYTSFCSHALPVGHYPRSVRPCVRACAPTVHACVSAVMGDSVSLHAHISWCLQRLICVDIQASFTRCLVSFCWSCVRPHKHVHKHSLDSSSWFPHLLLTFFSFSHLYLHPQQGICKMYTVLCLICIRSH